MDKWLEGLTAEQNIDGSSPPSSKWVPGGNTGKLKAARKGTGHPTSLCWRLKISVPLTGTPQRTESYMGLTFTFVMFNIAETRARLTNNVWDSATL